MKNVCYVVIFVGLTTNLFGQDNNQTEKFKKLNWLVGTWSRTNAKPGHTGIERWELASDSELKGFGINLQGKDTTFIEKLRIIVKDNNIVYGADVPENQKPVYFKLTEITESGFICESPDHDFPKKISYQLEGKKLKAKISGDSKAIDFLFQRE